MKLQIFGQEVAVKIKDLSEKGLKGFYDPIKKEIIICEKLDKAEKIQTLVHEVGHAALIRIYLGSIIPTEVHETIVDVIATAITENFEIKCKTPKKINTA
jgi:3-hydroxyacyl-CoA dehydrogenase